jgi:hypothetical protein
MNRPESRGGFGPVVSGLVGRLVLRAADWFEFGIAAMERDIVLRFADALGNNLGVAGRAVVTKHFGDEVVWSFSAFVHDADQAVSAVGALVSHRSCRCDRCRWRAPGESGKGLGAFFGIGNASEGEGECAEARDEGGFAIRCFHIRILSLCVSEICVATLIDTAKRSTGLHGIC